MRSQNPPKKTEVWQMPVYHTNLPSKHRHTRSLKQRKEQARNMSAQSSQTTHQASQAAEPTGAGQRTEVACVFGEVRLTATQHEVLCHALTAYKFQLGEYYPPDEHRAQAARDIEKIFSL